MSSSVGSGRRQTASSGSARSASGRQVTGNSQVTLLRLVGATSHHGNILLTPRAAATRLRLAHELSHRTSLQGGDGVSIGISCICRSVMVEHILAAESLFESENSEETNNVDRGRE